MTTRSTTPTSLFAAFAENAQAVAAKVETDVADATARYWRAVDRLAAGDATGGVNHRDFAGILETLGIDLDHARADVALVERLRQTRCALDAILAERADAEAAGASADAEAHARQADADRAKTAAQRARWRVSEAIEEASRLRIVIRDELRTVEAGLRAAGFAGELLAAPPPPPPKRRWRFRNGADATLYANLGPGIHLEDHSEVDMPADFCGYGNDSFGVPWTTLVGVVGPDSGPPQQKFRRVVPVGQRAGESAAAMSAVGPIDTAEV